MRYLGYKAKSREFKDVYGRDSAIEIAVTK
jgi:hypothetical protein